MPCKTTNYPNGLKVGNCLILESGAAIVFNSITVDENYTVLAEDDAVRVTGIRTITIPLGRVKPVVVYAVDSTVTLSLTPENESATLTVGRSYTLIPISTTGYYVG